jgi:CheY-like chemotaxis protein
MVRIDFNRLRFLVIDDNAHMRRILRTLLHGFGAREVYEAEDGAAGLEAFTHYMPDIVLADWVMPIFDGLELTQMIRQQGANANPYVPIIMLTDLGESALRAHLQRRRQPAPVRQDADLFRAGPAAQRQPELCRSRTAQGRQIRTAAPTAVARESASDGLMLQGA